MKRPALIAAPNINAVALLDKRRYPNLVSRTSKTDLAICQGHHCSGRCLAPALPLRHLWRFIRHQVTRWLALRAGVLRRAVSSWVRPLLQHRTSSVSVGRMPLRPALLPLAARSCAFARPVRLYKGGWVSTLPPVRPNRSLNRTHCGVPPFGLENPSPNAATPQRSG